jgi:stringent starvation protein B
VQVTTNTQLLEVEPGDHASVVVEIVNTGAVIDGVTARIIGFPDESVRSEPPLLPLFPDSTGQLTLALTVPTSLPAGRHPLTVEVTSHGAKVPSQFVDLNLDVAPRPALAVAATPRVVRARRQGRFVLQLSNRGNLALDVSLRAVDLDRAVQARFNPQQVHIPAGAVTPVLVNIRGPRMLFGAEIERSVTLEASARRADLATDADSPAVAESVHETAVRLKQRPLITRGPLTALILMSIIALWALVFLFGLNHVFSNDPVTKSVPPHPPRRTSAESVRPPRR